MQTTPSSAESLSSSILLVETELNSTHKKETLRHTNSSSVGSLPPAPPWFHSQTQPIPIRCFHDQLLFLPLLSFPPLAPSLEFHLETRSQKVHTKKRQTTQIKRKEKNLPEWSFLSFVLTSPLSCQGVRSRYFWQFTVIERRKRRRSDQSTSPTQANGCSSTAAIVRVAILFAPPLATSLNLSPIFCPPATEIERGWKKTVLVRKRRRSWTDDKRKWGWQGNNYVGIRN